jgi:RNA polymerase sigma factor (sigma-70 family)
MNPGLRSARSRADTSRMMAPFGEAFPSVLEAARVGAEWAWRALYEDLAPQLARYTTACRVSDPGATVGEVFLRAVEGVRSFEGDERAFRAWIFRIARNLVLDEHRKALRRRTDTVPAEVLVGLSPVGDVEQEALRSLSEQRVRAILDTLTPEQREVLLLRILGDLTVEEVAFVVGKRPGAVKALQARGLAAIRRNIRQGAVTL